ncbi:type VI immunity family protein [Vibrio gazogenes]|uniref:DUF3396 domain-containing protein n=1 Tax=Vibrio gazogenes DSM 21264 = NBRC 103151 TaxID=1123492 RepID=A0A1M5A4B7_VIBGA|nr:type VI immunity family protein [Vibrio gazogenes]USP13360.1 DUF3396 domain-containing protein [Vibrio gazogenes]SHF25055.1 Protein of unknown function [Vibrio gazogenes DSM 21264] [Vibrio gazogenes DSM 21264 = NBRC 103151]SJN57016.1 hypothetical protein BQ6471_02334 [Vibrio gazogenes]
MDPTLEQQLRLMDSKGQRVLMTVCLNLTMFFRGGNTPEKRQAILAMLTEYQQMMQGKLNFTTNPQTGSWKDLRKKPYQAPHDWLPELSDQEWEFVYHGGQHHRDASDIRFLVLGQASWQEQHGDLGWVTVNFPLNFFSTSTETFQDVALRWIEALQPLHGYGAISTTHNHFDDHEYESLEVQLAEQYPGLDIPDYIGHGLHLKEQIKGVNWLTIINQTHLDSIGGLSALETISGIRVWQRGDNTLVQAAEQPALAKIPPSYYQLGALLAPVRSTTLYEPHYEEDGFTEEAYGQWLARFDTPNI